LQEYTHISRISNEAWHKIRQNMGVER